jgi:transposase
MLFGVIWRRGMGRFIEGCDRREQLFLPPCVDDYVAEGSAVRIVDMFVDELDLAALGFADAAATGRPGYHPATLLKLYIYGYLNQVQSSRRLEREAGRNVELMWPTGKLAPDFRLSPTSVASTALRSRQRVGASCCYAVNSASSRAGPWRWTAVASAR